MKKILTLITLSALFVVLLFAQEVSERLQPTATVAPAPSEAVEPQPEMEEPVAQIEEVVEAESPVEAPAPAAEQEEDLPEVDEIGISEDMTAGADVAGGRISLSLKNVELQDVVRLFSRLSNANIIIPDLLDEDDPKRIDVNLENVEWKPALQAILDTHGLELFEKIPGTEVYSIRARAADAPEPKEIKVFKLKYASVNEVVEMVSALVESDAGEISTYPARNAIVAQGSAQLLSDLDKVIQAVDLPREQVFIEAKFLELSDSASEQLGIDWNVLGGYKLGASSISGDYSYEQSRTDNVNRFMDVAGRSYEALEDDPAGAAIDYAERPGNLADDSRIFGIIPTRESIDSAVVGRTLGATLTADDFNVVLSALKEMNGAKVVSNPKIIVANEETAIIHIGQKLPNVKGTTTSAGDTQIITTYELDAAEPYFEDGIKVNVTPTVNTADNITVRIQPTLDRLLDATTAPDGTDFYGKTTKTIDTVFGLQSGQTAAIGGLTEVTKSDIDRKIPLLGDLPVLGRLFSYSSKNNQQTETIIFVTVGLANPKDLDFGTGLPEDSTLALRHRAEAQVNRAIEAEELKIFQTMEDERMDERLQKIRQAEEKRRSKLHKPEEAAEMEARGLGEAE